MSGDLLGRDPLVQALLDDLAIGSWQEINHLPKQDKKIPFLRRSFRVYSQGCLVLERILAVANMGYAEEGG